MGIDSMKSIQPPRDLPELGDCLVDLYLASKEGRWTFLFSQRRELSGRDRILVLVEPEWLKILPVLEPVWNRLLERKNPS
jgi:hypothetical protein